MIETIGEANAARPPAATGTLSGFDSETFLRLFVAQLQNQNPLEPMDATEMLQQTSQFASVEAMQNLAAVQQQMLGIDRFTAASTLIGQRVEALALDGSIISGTVTEVRPSADGPVLRIDSAEVSFDRVVRVTSPQEGSP